MMRNRSLLGVGASGAAITIAAALALALFHSPLGSVHAAKLINPPPFDFTDDFYRINGIKPEMLTGRAGNPDRNPAHWVVDTTNTDPTRRNIRVVETTGGFDKDGNLLYYNVMGNVPSPLVFTDDAAGARAQQIANSFRAFLFPKTMRNPDGSVASVKLDPAPPNRRQDNVFDTRNRYFCDNQLGLWILTFVVYTQKAFTPDGMPALGSLAFRNGLDLDGTPLLRTVAEITDLASQGLVELKQRPLDGSQGPPWVV